MTRAGPVGEGDRAVHFAPFWPISSKFSPKNRVLRINDGNVAFQVSLADTNKKGDLSFRFGDSRLCLSLAVDAGKKSLCEKELQSRHPH